MSERFAWIYDPVAGVKRWVADMWSRRHILTLEDDVSDLQTAVSGLTGGKSVPYGYCTTAAETAAKTVTVSPAVTELVTGLTIAVKFQYTNTGSNPTLNVNSLGAKAIKRYGTTAAGTSAAANWNANSVVMLTYDGTYWMMVDFNNTTYSGMTDAEYQAGTGTSNRLITPARLKAAIELHAPVQSVNGQTGTVTLDASDVGALPDTTAIPDASTATPAMDGTGAAGTSDDYAREDHVHPSDTSKQDALTTAQLAAVNSGVTSDDVDFSQLSTAYTTNSYVTQTAFNRLHFFRVGSHTIIFACNLQVTAAMTDGAFHTIGTISGVTLQEAQSVVLTGQNGTGHTVLLSLQANGTIQVYSKTASTVNEFFRAIFPLVVASFS